MKDIRCDYLSADGKCEGLYDGFGCIKDKCKQPSKIKSNAKGCQYMRGDGYCTKFGKLICPGPENCKPE